MFVLARTLPTHSHAHLLTACRTGDRTGLFTDRERFPKVFAVKDDINSVVEKIRTHRGELRKQLRMPSLDYVTVSGQEVCMCGTHVEGHPCVRLCLRSWGTHSRVRAHVNRRQGSPCRLIQHPATLLASLAVPH